MISECIKPRQSSQHEIYKPALLFSLILSRFSFMPESGDIGRAAGKLDKSGSTNSNGPTKHTSITSVISVLLLSHMYFYHKYLFCFLFSYQSHCMWVLGKNHVLCDMWTGKNHGPLSLLRSRIIFYVTCVRARIIFYVTCVGQESCSMWHGMCKNHGPLALLSAGITFYVTCIWARIMFYVSCVGQESWSLWPAPGKLCSVWDKNHIHCDLWWAKIMFHTTNLCA